MSELGLLLHRLVEAYAGFGAHRTGTDVDEVTRAWFVSELERRGADVTEVPYEFERYDAHARLTVSGREITTVPLWYAGGGRIEGVEPAVRALEVLGGYVPIGLDAALDAVRTSGAPGGVLATTGSGGRLIAVNREVEPASGPPVVLAPGRDLDALMAGATRLSAEARVVPGASATIIGHLGSTSGEHPPVVVTTPLSGWFACAGERGTGVAVALELAVQLAAEGPVVVVATTGHELGHLGARHWLAQDADPSPRAVIHLGASVAAGQPPATYSPLRFAMTTVDGTLADALAEVLEPAALPVRDVAAPWPGEGEEWRRLRVPVLSVTGAFEQFHTPDDVPAAVTSDVLLERAHDALLAATRLVRDGQPMS